MSRLIGTEEIRDTNTHLVHDLKPSPHVTVIIQVTNDLNEQVDIEFVGSRANDTAFSEAVVLETGKNVASGESGHYYFDEPWGRIGVRLSCSQAPVSGDVTVYLVA